MLKLSKLSGLCGTRLLPIKAAFGKANYPNEKSTQTDTQPETFTPVYKLPLINTVGAVNRIKLYHTVATAFALPSSLLLNQMNLLSGEQTTLVFTAGICGCAVCYSLGYFCENFVGIVYINDEETKAKLSYANFWGRRKDEVVPIGDVIPLAEVPATFTDGLYLTLGRYSTGRKLKINVRNGTILDGEKFNKIFGDV